jgi:HEAT repeat protein
MDLLGEGGPDPVDVMAVLIATRPAEGVDPVVIASFLESDDPFVAVTAGRALGLLAPQHTEATGKLEALVKALGKTGDLDVPTTLELLVSIHASLVRLGAVPAPLDGVMLGKLTACDPSGKGHDEASSGQDCHEVVDFEPDIPHEDLALAVPLLTEVLEQGTPALRCSAATALAKAGDAAAPAIPALLALLDDGDPALQVCALPALGALGSPEGWQLAIDLYTDPEGDPEDQDAAMEYMRALGAPPVQVADSIILAIEAGLSDDSAGLLEVLAQGGPQHIDRFIEALDDADPMLATAILAAIGSMGPEASAATPTLVRMLDGAGMQRFGAIAEAISAIGPADPSKLASYASSVEDPDPIVRVTAMILLGSVVMDFSADNPGDGLRELLDAMLTPILDVVPVLADKLSTGSTTERIAATLAIGTFGPLARDHVGAMLPNLQSDDEALVISTIVSMVMVSSTSTLWL